MHKLWHCTFQVWSAFLMVVYLYIFLVLQKDLEAFDRTVAALRISKALSMRALPKGNDSCRAFKRENTIRSFNSS